MRKKKGFDPERFEERFKKFLAAEGLTEPTIELQTAPPQHGLTALSLYVVAVLAAKEGE